MIVALLTSCAVFATVTVVTALCLCRVSAQADEAAREMFPREEQTAAAAPTLSKAA